MHTVGGRGRISLVARGVERCGARGSAGFRPQVGRGTFAGGLEHEGKFQRQSPLVFL